MSARASLVILFGAATVAACGGSDRARVDVFAASSLHDVFEVIEREVEARQPGIDVVVSTGGSSSLAAQIEGGAPADVFAAADGRTMQRVVDAGRTRSEPQPFARNRLAIAVESGNPFGVTGLDDLVGLPTVVMAAPEVPAGAYAAQLLAAVSITVDAASLEQSVRSVASKVALGEADAGIVYVTDGLARADDLDLVELGDLGQPEIVYPIVALHGSSDGATLVVDAVLGPIGREALADAGFLLP